MYIVIKKVQSCIQETKHRLTDADSTTDAIGGWTKNTPKPDFFEKQKKIIQNGGVLHYAKPLKYLDWDKAVITRTKFKMG